MVKQHDNFKQQSLRMRERSEGEGERERERGRENNKGAVGKKVPTQRRRPETVQASESCGATVNQKERQEDTRT